ncbi:MAG: pseudouridine synthase [Agriterribacter sp.]
MSKKGFDKFINKESGAKKKERIRQEKKQIRAEKNAYFEEQKRLKRESKKAAAGGQRAAVSGQQSAETSKRSAVGGERVMVNKQRKAVNSQRPNISSNQKSAIKNQQSEISTKSQISNPKSEISEMPLNKFIAWSGVCGRREAADLIKAGKVLVNGQVITEPPHRVSQQDNIRVNGKKIALQKNLVYILLNKPKDYITTTDDPEGRKTVMDLIKHATTERVFPVGRLDRNTTGVMLLTNDGELAQRLTHPKYEVKKIYEVRVDQPVTKQQLDTIATGITLEDGFIQPDAVAYADTKDKSVIGIEIHSGRNRIVRRIFEHLGFKVKNLDRVMYGIFTKKNVDRGKWRFLSEKEIRLLKHLNTSFANKKSPQQGAKK